MKEVVKQSGPHADEAALEQVDFDRLAAQVIERCDELAACSDDAGRITRVFCSPAMQRAHELVRRWMKAARMTAAVDAGGNLVGRYKPPGSYYDRAVLVGSHLDSVVNAGRYDGVLGVAMGIAVAEAVRATGASMPFDVEVIAFSDEEGVRFGVPFIGSRWLAGTLDERLLEIADEGDVTMEEALVRFGVPSSAGKYGGLDDGEVVAYLEPHIEQGTRLEEAGEPLGVVVAIAGQTRLTLTWSGQGGHAGTAPMQGRRDPLVAAGRWTAAVHEMGCSTPGLVATVGRVTVDPNATNCIPRQVETSLDVRHADDAIRQQATRHFIETAERLAADAGLGLRVEYDHEHAAIAMNAELTDRLASSITPTGLSAPRLVSGAGHDAGVMAQVAPTAMLFLRSPGGVSHDPAEAVTQDDVAIGLKALVRCILSLAHP